MQRHNVWAGLDGQTGDGAFNIRFRTPVIEVGETSGYGDHVLVVWPFADEGSSALPDDAQALQLAQFEKLLCDAWEGDGLAFLAAVLTFDGARQWVFYTADVPSCGQRLTTLTQTHEAYPVQLTRNADPDWSYLRDSVLQQVHWHEHQAEWNERLDREVPE
ncbi:MAG: DUF695 domain-containing protein [Planctomycetota bacterium]